MRKDFDYVEMSDYERDMRESGEMAANAVRVLRREIDGLKQMLWLSIMAAGGKVEISAGDITRFDASRAMIETTYRIDTNTQQIRAYQKPHP